MIRVSGQSKSRPVKAAGCGAEKSKIAPRLWREARVQVKMLKNWGSGTTFWSSDVEKLHTTVARSTCPSQNAKNWRSGTTFWSSDVEKLHTTAARSACPSQNAKKLTDCWSGTTFWSSDVEKLHAVVARSTCPSQNAKKTEGLGPLFEVQMSKNCTPLWPEAHVQVKMLKNWGSGTTFWSSDVEKLHAVVARSTVQVKTLKNWGSGTTFWSSDVEELPRRCGEKHAPKSKC